MKVAIVGAGPCGLFLAHVLAASGHSVHVVEQRCEYTRPNLIILKAQLVNRLQSMGIELPENKAKILKTGKLVIQLKELERLLFATLPASVAIYRPAKVVALSQLTKELEIQDVETGRSYILPFEFVVDASGSKRVLDTFLSSPVIYDHLPVQPLTSKHFVYYVRPALEERHVEQIYSGLKKMSEEIWHRPFASYMPAVWFLKGKVNIAGPLPKTFPAEIKQNFLQSVVREGLTVPLKSRKVPQKEAQNGAVIDVELLARSTPFIDGAEGVIGVCLGDAYSTPYHMISSGVNTGFLQSLKIRDFLAQKISAKTLENFYQRTVNSNQAQVEQANAMQLLNMLERIDAQFSMPTVLAQLQHDPSRLFMLALIRGFCVSHFCLEKTILQNISAEIVPAAIKKAFIGLLAGIYEWQTCSSSLACLFENFCMEMDKHMFFATAAAETMAVNTVQMCYYIDGHLKIDQLKGLSPVERRIFDASVSFVKVQYFSLIASNTTESLASKMLNRIFFQAYQGQIDHLVERLSDYMPQANRSSASNITNRDKALLPLAGGFFERLSTPAQPGAENSANSMLEKSQAVVSPLLM